MAHKEKDSSLRRNLKYIDDDSDTVIERLPELYQARKSQERDVTVLPNETSDQLDKLDRVADNVNILIPSFGKGSGVKDLAFTEMSDSESSIKSSGSKQDVNVSSVLPSDQTFNRQRRVSIVGPVQRSETPVKFIDSAPNVTNPQPVPAICVEDQTERTSAPTLVKSLPGCTGVHLVPASEWDAMKNELGVLSEEKDLFHKQLAVQIKVNSDLKKLLVASLGDDLHYRVDRLTWEKAQLSEELGDKDRQVSEGCETLDQVSIQADLWRTKYLASRVQLDEHAKSQGFLNTHYAESLDALHELLSERHEVRSNQSETHRLLRQICRAFDPLNSRSMNSLTALASTNLLELSRGNLRLTEAVRFRLLPPSSPAMPPSGSSDQWEDNMTPAETAAHEFLNRSHEESLAAAAATTTKARPGIASSMRPIDRYHPHVRYNNLTFNCCPTCEGEIKLV